MPSPNNARTSPLTSRYRYNETAGRYTTNDGRFVPQIKIKQALDRQITATEKRMLKLSGQLQKETIDLQEWRTGMLAELKTLHIANAAAAKGGWAQMTQADWGMVGGRLKRQYEYLNRFASQIQYKTQPLDGRFTQRVKMYAGAARGTFEDTRANVADDLGFDQEANVLGNAEHCDECVAQTAQGWVDLGTLVPVGERICKTNCHCTMKYRNSATGKIFK